MACMADIYLLTGLTLPQGVAHESLPGTVTLFHGGLLVRHEPHADDCPRETAGSAPVVARQGVVPVRQIRRVRVALERWCRRMPAAGRAAARRKKARWGSTGPPDRRVP